MSWRWLGNPYLCGGCGATVSANLFSEGDLRLIPHCYQKSWPEIIFCQNPPFISRSNPKVEAKFCPNCRAEVWFDRVGNTYIPYCTSCGTAVMPVAIHQKKPLTLKK